MSNRRARAHRREDTTRKEGKEEEEEEEEGKVLVNEKLEQTSIYCILCVMQDGWCCRGTGSTPATTDTLYCVHTGGGGGSEFHSVVVARKTQLKASVRTK